MSTPESSDRTPEAEHKNHRYIGSHIPWYVHLLWISFWCFAIVYTFTYVFPAIQKELLSPP
jgi:hypothetical protein